MNDLADLKPENLNVRYLAWTINKKSHSWVNVLKKKAGIPETRARAILRGAPLTNSERIAIAEGFSVVLDDLVSDGLFGFHGPELYRENIKFLVCQLPHGEGQKMAQYIPVTKKTVSEWKKTGITAKAKPSKILQYLGLDMGIDLYNIPLFLSLDPIGKFEIKNWIIDHLNNISSDELIRLFPALKKLLSHYEGD